MKKIGFIPLRKGSKGIPNKNIRLFCGKPLFEWSLDTFIQANIVDELWIATDCAEIKKIISSQYPQVRIFHRSDASATDDAPTIWVVLEFLNQYHYSPQDWFILLQATSPLTSIRDLKELDKQIETDNYDSCISCLRLKRFRWTDQGVSLDYALDRKPRRQDYGGFLVESGSFYASKIGHILQNKQITSSRIRLIEVGPQAMIDIDEQIDWEMGEVYCKYLQRKES